MSPGNSTQGRSEPTRVGAEHPHGSAFPLRPSIDLATGVLGDDLEVEEEHVAAEAPGPRPGLDPGQVDARRENACSASTSAPGWSAPSSGKTSEVFHARRPRARCPPARSRRTG